MHAQFAVLGDPISHSLSPKIHALFAEQMQISLDYRAVRCSALELPEQLKAFAGAGLNLTLPLKQIAGAHCASVSPAAAFAGAVNTLSRRAEGWHGDNTDGSGLVRDLSERHQVLLAGKRVLIIGAGGAAAGVIPALLAAQAGSIAISNRTQAKADVLAAHFGVQSVALDDFQGAAFDLIIHASAAGHANTQFHSPARILHAGSVAYDLSYGAAAAPFLSWASEADCTAYDGLGMLIEQAADAFAIWHQVRPNTAPVWGALRATI
jgi:shikimate dehydrogenase